MRSAAGQGGAGHRHRDDRRRAQHGGEGARGPRLLRRRQPAARPCCATWCGSSTTATARDQPIAVVVDVRTGSFFDVAAGATASPGVGGDTTLCSSRPPTTSSSAARRRPAAPTRCRAAAGSSTASHREREVLAELRGEADLVIDTTSLNVHQLTTAIAEAFGTPDTTRLQGHRGQLRLQVRHPRRRRPRGRHALPAEPVLGARAAPADRARRDGARTT